VKSITSPKREKLKKNRGMEEYDLDGSDRPKCLLDDDDDVMDVDTSVSLSGSSFILDEGPLVMQCNESLDAHLVAEEDWADDREVFQVFDFRPLLQKKKEEEEDIPMKKKKTKEERSRGPYAGLALPKGPAPTMRTRRQYQGLHIKAPALFPLKVTRDNNRLITKPKVIKKKKLEPMTIPVGAPLTPIHVALPPVHVPKENTWRVQQPAVTVFGM
jgi:hypothetical protein